MYNVSIVKTSPKPSIRDIKNTISKSLSYLGGLESLVPKHCPVLIKPNIGDTQHYLTGHITDWRVVEAIISLLQEYGIKQIKIAEASAIGIDTQMAFEAGGYCGVAKRTGTVLVDLKQDEIREVDIPNSLSLDKIKIFKTVLDAEFIVNVPKLKTVPAVPVSLSMKNLKGVLPDPVKKLFHNVNLSHCVVDLNKVVKSQLIIIDGIIGCDIYQPKELNIIITGNNIVAVDTVGSMVMGIDPKKVEYLIQAEKLKMGSTNIDKIEIHGEKIKNVFSQFTRPSENNQFNYLFPGINFVFSDNCTSCATNLYRALSILKDQKRLNHLAGVTIALGTNPPVGKCNQVIYVGNCTKQAAKEGYIFGCPPISFELAKILGNYQFD